MFGNRHLPRETPQRIPGLVEHLVAIGSKSRQRLVDARDGLHVARDVEVGEDLMDEFLCRENISLSLEQSSGPKEKEYIYIYIYLVLLLGEPF